MNVVEYSTSLSMVGLISKSCRKRKTLGCPDGKIALRYINTYVILVPSLSHHLNNDGPIGRSHTRVLCLAAFCGFDNY